MMRMGIGPVLRMKLTTSQKMILKLLLEFRKVHKDLPNATKGIEGIIKANNILKEKEESGILIGGLSTKIWNQKRTKKELSQHKDVEVLVLKNSNNKNLSFEEFEGGIDWWLPKNGKGNIYLSDSDAKKTEIELNWWGNSFNIPLNFGIKKNYKNLNSGLYILNPKEVIDIKFNEILSSIDSRVEIDSEIEEKYKEEIEKKMKTSLPNFIKKELKESIVISKYSNLFQSYSIGRNKIIEINRIRNL